MQIFSAMHILQRGQKLCNHRSASFVFRQLIFDLTRSKDNGNQLVVGILEHHFTQDRFNEIIFNIKYLSSFKKSVQQIKQCSEIDRIKVLYAIHNAAKKITNLASGSSDGRLFNIKTGQAVSRNGLQKYLKSLNLNLEHNFSEV